jgi:DNA mismatch repair protein MutS
MAKTKRLTPMMRQYFQIKSRHRDVILFFQLGDFYETFYEDAELCARELDLVLTKREGAPMAGVPIKKASPYINRLLKKGYKVAICDQVQDPSEAAGIVERDVVRIVTPGTALDEDVLERGKSHHIAAVWVDVRPGRERVGLAVADVSTGEFRATELERLDEARHELSRLQPVELVIPSDYNADELRYDPDGRLTITARQRSEFKPDIVTEHFGLISLEGLGLTAQAARAAGGLLQYLRETQKEGLSHLSQPTVYSTSEQMGLDPFTQRNLELVQELRTGGEGNTLLTVLNETITGMGERLLRKWLLSPLLDRTAIERRLDMVELFYENELARRELRDLLAQIYDIERLAGRLGTNRANPRDLLSLQQSLQHLPALKAQLTALLEEGGAERLKQLAQTLEGLRLDELAEELQRALRDDAPLTVKEGGILKERYSPELDQLKGLEREYKQKILELEGRERERTKIPSLKVGYNTVFGYYIEVTKTHAKRVPEDYIRKQTLTQAERYITPELKGYEEKILSSQEKARSLEYELFCRLRDRVAKRVKDIQTLAKAIAELDVYAALAEAAKRRGYRRPEFTEHYEIEIREGRHPVVEVIQKDQAFVPNDLQLAEDEILVVLTGPNMSGKSTWLRQNALICLMAQMGSFVPAKRAVLPIVDKIFTRVGASDMLAFGYSTFMVEMIETANILNNATERSLVILDEMGRGTSTFDGVSIAWAVADYLVKNIKAKTLFATHYHELTLLAEKLPGVVNMHVLVKEYGDDVIFLHRVERGVAEGSYGVHVAKLAGLPKDVTDTASDILYKILQGNPLEAIEGKRPLRPRVIKQPALFGGEPHPVVEELKKIDVNALTPIEALNLLVKLKEKL